MKSTPVHALESLCLIAAAILGCGPTAAPEPSRGATEPSTGSETPAARAATSEPPAEQPEHAPPAAAPPPQVTPGDAQKLLAEEKQAYEAALPVFEKHCVECHAPRGARSRRKTLEHLDLGSYPFGGQHAHAMGVTIREVLGANGQEATMPYDDPGAVQGEELALVVAWTHAFDRSHAAGLHRHGDHGGASHGH